MILLRPALPGFLALFSLTPTFVLEVDLFGAFLAFDLPPADVVD